MEKYFTYPLPGCYQYTYPTFVDTPQYICVHFFTSDGQKAFVSYPHHPNRKAAQLIPVSWFQSVVMVELDGEPRLMKFLDVILTGWFSGQHHKPLFEKEPLDELNEYRFGSLFAA
jgi:hypothetical protein